MAKPGQPKSLTYLLSLLVLLYAFTSGAIAVASADRCGDAPKRWELVPPGWVCEPWRR
jgi:hypothetical protein